MSLLKRVIELVLDLQPADVVPVLRELSRRGVAESVRTRPYERGERWSAGPWDQEPYNAVEWTDAWTGYRCFMRRNHSGAWCGYVNVPEGHRAYGRSVLGALGDDDDYRILWRYDVHGEITYTGPIEGLYGFWIGFDCNHSGDRNAVTSAWAGGGEYRDMWYVRQVTERLAYQLKEDEIR